MQYPSRTSKLHEWYL